MEYRPIADWLRETRERHFMPNGDEWTQDYLLARMSEEIDWAPHRPNYSKYETGKATPKRDTLAKFVAFWARYDEPGPDLEPKPAPPAEPTLASALSDLAAELRASRQERETLAKELADLKEVVRTLVGQGTPTNPGLGVPPETAV